MANTTISKALPRESSSTVMKDLWRIDNRLSQRGRRAIRRRESEARGRANIRILFAKSRRPEQL